MPCISSLAVPFINTGWSTLTVVFQNWIKRRSPRHGCFVPQLPGVFNMLKPQTKRRSVDAVLSAFVSFTGPSIEKCVFCSGLGALSVSTAVLPETENQPRQIWNACRGMFMTFSLTSPIWPRCSNKAEHKRTLENNWLLSSGWRRWKRSKCRSISIVKRGGETLDLVFKSHEQHRQGWTDKRSGEEVRTERP